MNYFGTHFASVRAFGAGGRFAGPQPIGLGAGLEDVGAVGEPVDDRGGEAPSGKTEPHSPKGRLLATAIEARSSRSVMTWKSSSAPRGSRWT